MTINPSMAANLVNVRGTQLQAGDTRELYRQKIARITLDSMVQFVGLLDAQGTVLEINQVALDGVGIKLSDVEGRPFWTTFWWQVRDEGATLRASIERAARGEFVRWDAEIYGRASGAETIIIDASLSPVMDDSGKVVFITAEGRDITEKKAQEREIARQRAELARLDELKTQFFANISHEFRTPLTLMLGPLEDAMLDHDEPLTDRQRERVAMAARNGRRLQKLVNTLLDFSRVEAGRIQAAYQPVDLAALTRDLASSFRSACEKADLVLGIRAPTLSQPVHVDPEMWEKIVLNLVSNAFKFTLEGGITVDIAEDDGHAVLRVSDTGTGIPQAEVPRVFDRFHRVEGARGRTHEGTGIGLALVKELVELHKGSVSVDSEPGRGTTFEVRIPFGSTHLPQDRVEGARTQASTATRAEVFVSEALRWLPEDIDAMSDVAAPPAQHQDATGKRPHVLLADDNADMRDYLRRLLSPHYELTCTANGEDAFGAARRQRPDLILTDVMMPRVDGFELLRKLRADAGLHTVPVVVLSARAGEEAKVEGLRRGADDYLVKPFSARELLARVAANIELSVTRLQGSRLMQEEARSLELLNKVGTAVAAELNLDRAVQVVTDAATALTGAGFGAFFYNLLDEKGESYMLYALSGVPREAFSKFPMPRNTAVFAPTFKGEGIVRSDDILLDPRYGRNQPHFGMPQGHLPVRSYLAAPVVSRSGEVLGGLFFGHPEPGVFTARHERLLVGIGAQAAIAIDNARLFQAAEREVAERRRAEAALQSLNATLEQRVLDEVDERAKAEEQLRQVQKMEAVGQLTGGIAHDFNNMLAVIMGSLNLLQRKLAKNDTDVERFVDAAIDGTRRAAALTNRLLAFSRQQSLAPEAVDVNGLVAGMSDMLTRTLGEPIRVETVLGAEVGHVMADRTQLENAVLNLCVNARDAMPDGGKLTLETSNVTIDDVDAREYAISAGAYVRIAATDSGLGMTPDVMARAFEPFFTTKGVGKGTGLGLSQVYGFVRQSGGHVKVESEPGRGTVVKIYLPRHVGEAMPAGAPAALRTQVRRGTQAEIVMVVEDEQRLRTVSVEALCELGYTVIEAASAHDALRMLDEGRAISMLFTDVVMPEMSGRELAERARQRVPGLKVLFTTGYTRRAIPRNGVLGPGTRMLTKPFSVDELALKVRQVLDS
ncbi:ATP-binding protein [Variovorax sp. dw_308]|uniref:ATP-binding protein n=1 Tax=Variovorax sp. dw_308 TaxID=2721546 RepID=UPI001C437915|nr:ATP-binding protein [Variovorax sp. dw_308]